MGSISLTQRIPTMAACQTSFFLQQFDESRTRLGLDTLDILYLHRWDPETPLYETFEALHHLQETGKLRYIGVSNFAAWQVMKAQAVAQSIGTRIDILQPMYSLVKRLRRDGPAFIRQALC